MLSHCINYLYWARQRPQQFWPTIAGLFIIGQLKVRLKEKHNTRNKSNLGDQNMAQKNVKEE